MLAQSTTTTAEVTPARARKAKAEALSSQPTTSPLDEQTRSLIQAALVDPVGCTKPERRALDNLFPNAKKPEVRMDWAGLARDLKTLHDWMSNGLTKVGDDQGVVGDAYRKARRASQRDAGATSQLSAAIAIETIAREFTRDGTYANYAVNPDGIRHISALVGELQRAARALNRDNGVPAVAIDKVFFSGWREPAVTGAAAVDHRAAFHETVWTHLVEEFEAAQARSNAVPIDLPDEEAGPISDAMAEAQMRVLMAPAPGIEAHLYKLHFGIDEQRHHGQTLDDVLRLMIREGWHTQREAIAYLDAWQLARSAGVDNDLTRVFYPRAINARLATMGCHVTHWCLSTPKGFRGEAMALYGMFTEAEQHQLFAAAWIDGFLSAGGTLHLWKNGDSDKRVLHFGVSMDHQPELQPFVDALSDPSKDGGPPPPSEQRLDVAKLAAEQMNERGIDYMGAEEAGLPPVDPYATDDSTLVAAE